MTTEPISTFAPTDQWAEVPSTVAIVTAAVPEPKPLSDGDRIMQSQRAVKKRLFLLHHNRGNPIRTSHAKAQSRRDH